MKAVTARLVLSILTCAVLLTACERAPAGAAGARLPAAGIGGPFHLIDQDGRPVSDKSLLGKPSAIFFGFTYCPEICPTTMADISGWLRALGPAADRLNVVFVSVDPERDTPAQLKLYLSNFDRRIQGFTGSPEAIAAAARAYRVYYRKVPTEGGEYTVDHSSAIYLFDDKGAFVEPIGYGGPPERGLAQLRALIGR